MKGSSGILSTNSSPAHTPRLVKAAVAFVEQNIKSPSINGASPKSSRSVTWTNNIPDKSTFTMRREFERAKEEADLIEQLRNVIYLFFISFNFFIFIINNSLTLFYQSF